MKNGRSAAQAGQTQILMAAAISTVMVTIALFTLQFSQRASKFEVEGSKNSEMRTALDGAAKVASQFYHTQAGCNPAKLNELLNRLNEDGTLADPASAKTRRARNLVVNGILYRVAFGPVTRLGGSTTATTDAQDAVLELWTGNERMRVTQRIALINNCTYYCPGATTEVVDALTNTTMCVSAQAKEAAVAYHQITAPSSFPTAASDTIPTCGGGRYLGDLDVHGSSCAAPAQTGEIDIADLVVLRNYLRSGDWRGSCVDILVGTGVGNADDCADFNRDGLVNDIDLNLMEKVLRGYVNVVPTRCKFDATDGDCATLD